MVSMIDITGPVENYRFSRPDADRLLTERDAGRLPADEKTWRALARTLNVRDYQNRPPGKFNAHQVSQGNTMPEV